MNAGSVEVEQQTEDFIYCFRKQKGVQFKFKYEKYSAIVS